MDVKDKVSIWAGIIAVAVLEAEDRVNTQLDINPSDWPGAVGAVVDYVIGFVILYLVARWVLGRYFKDRTPKASAQQIPKFDP